MNESISSLILSTIATILLYGFYWAFTSREKYFLVNRIYLLSSLIFSLLLPFIHINLSLFSAKANLSLPVLELITLPELTITANHNSFISLSSIVLIIYLIGAAIFTIKFIIKILTIVSLIRHSKIIKSGSVNIVEIKDNYTPFSFFNYIFINSHHYSGESYKKIILHEKEHIREGHSFDLIFVEIARILQWYNPIMILYSHSLRHIHEYSVDDHIIELGIKRNDYFELLFSTISGKQFNNISNNFNYLLTKKRILMMTQLRKSKWVTVKFLLALPLAAALLFANGIQAQTGSPKDAQAKKVTEVKEAQKVISSQPVQKIAVDPQKESKKEVTQDEEKVFQMPEVMPEFPGGMEALYAYLGKNLNYPKAAKENQVQGSVVINFIIEKDGKVSNVKVMTNNLKGKENTPQSAIDECVNEATKIIKNMPDWKPGTNKGKAVRTIFNIPIRFALK